MGNDSDGVWSSLVLVGMSEPSWWWVFIAVLTLLALREDLIDEHRGFTFALHSTGTVTSTTFCPIHGSTYLTEHVCRQTE